VKVYREKVYSSNLDLDSRENVNTLVGVRGMLDLFVSSLLIKFSQVLFP